MTPSVASPENGPGPVPGDPIGDPEAWPGAVEATLELARRHAWTPAVIGCGERGATVWIRYGLGAYELGDEAVDEGSERRRVPRLRRVGRLPCLL